MPARRCQRGRAGRADGSILGAQLPPPGGGAGAGRLRFVAGVPNGLDSFRRGGMSPFRGDLVWEACAMRIRRPGPPRRAGSSWCTASSTCRSSSRSCATPSGGRGSRLRPSDTRATASRRRGVGARDRRVPRPDVVRLGARMRRRPPGPLRRVLARGARPSLRPRRAPGVPGRPVRHDRAAQSRGRAPFRVRSRRSPSAAAAPPSRTSGRAPTLSAAFRPRLPAPGSSRGTARPPCCTPPGGSAAPSIPTTPTMARWSCGTPASRTSPT